MGEVSLEILYWDDFDEPILHDTDELDNFPGVYDLLLQFRELMREVIPTVELVFDHVLDDLHLNFHIRRDVGGVRDHVDTEVVDC